MTAPTSVFIVDMQGFQYGSQNFLCKEIAILRTENNYTIHKIIKMPYDLSVYNNSFRRHMNWTTKNFHGLQWGTNDDSDDGFNDGEHAEDNLLPQEEISEFIKSVIPMEAIILVKGLQKKNYLNKFIENEIVDVSERNYPPLAALKEFGKSKTCAHHINSEYSCSLENVHNLYFIYKYLNKK